MNENIETTIDILGCCVCRDTFGMHEGNGGYMVNKYVQIPSPISLVTKSPCYKVGGEIKNDIFNNKSNFIKRCQILELNKKVFDYFRGGGEMSDYFIMDCAESRKNILYFPETKGYFTESHTDLLKKYIENGVLPPKYKIIDILEMDKKELYQYLKEYCDNILTLYDRQHIILFEIRAVEFQTDGKTIEVSPTKPEVAKSYNDRMQLCFDYVKEYLKGCHIIEFPNGVVGDINHKWGRALLHYVQEYYDYAKQAVDIITQNNGNDIEEEAELKKLKLSYEKIFKEKYEDILRTTLVSNRREKQVADKMINYEKYFKKLLLEDSKERIRKYLEDNHIKECAFYGKTQIAYVYLSWFKKWNIKILYVVENHSKVSEWEGIPLVQRNDINLLISRNMIICDANDEAVKKKLRNFGYKGTIISYKQLI